MHRLRRRTAVALVVATATVVGGGPAGAARSMSEPVEAARASVDDIALRWFAAQAAADEIEQRLAVVESRVEVAQEQATTTLEIATARALQIYKGAGATFPDLINGDDALQSARRVELIDSANAESDAALDDLEAVTEDLRYERAELRRALDRQATVLADLEAERTDLVAALDAAVAADRAASARKTVAQGPRAAASTPPPPASSTSPDTVTTSTPAPSPDPADDVAQPDPAPAATGAHPRHDEAFLACTRSRESGGSYTAVNPAGYYGAYQFSPLTWDATASHAGRLELAGVLPSQRFGVRPGRPRVGPLPVAGQRPLGWPLLTVTTGRRPRVAPCGGCRVPSGRRSRPVPSSPVR